jgi:hypothetical protein
MGPSGRSRSTVGYACIRPVHKTDSKVCRALAGTRVCDCDQGARDQVVNRHSFERDGYEGVGEEGAGGCKESAGGRRRLSRHQRRLDGGGGEDVSATPRMGEQGGPFELETEAVSNMAPLLDTKIVPLNSVPFQPLTPPDELSVVLDSVNTILPIRVCVPATIVIFPTSGKITQVFPSSHRNLLGFALLYLFLV